MRLLYIHEQLGAWGGAETNILATAKALRQRGHDLGLLYRSGTGRDEAAWRETFSECFRLEDGPADTEAAGALAAFAPDVAYLHKMSDLGVLTALTRGKVPVVHMVHDHDLYCMRGYKYNALTRRPCTQPASLRCLVPCGAFVRRQRDGRWPLRWVGYAAKKRELELNRRFHRLIVASHHMKEELLRNGFLSSQIENHAPVPPQPRTAVEPTFSDRNRIVYAGQIVRGKGVDILLEILARVRARFECLIVGDGSHRPACQALCRRLGLEDRVRFTGFIPPSEIAALYGEASIAVMSSVWPEPFGAVGLEAMRCGLPVVAFDAGGIKEWLADGINGCLVPWMNRQVFAERIETLLADKDLARRLGAAGRLWAEERFNFDAYLSGLEDLFRRTAEHAAAAAPD